MLSSLREGSLKALASCNLAPGGRKPQVLPQVATVTSGNSPAGLFMQMQELFEVARLLKRRATREETYTFREEAILYRLLFTALEFSGGWLAPWIWQVDELHFHWTWKAHTSMDGAASTQERRFVIHPLINLPEPLPLWTRIVPYRD